MAKSETVEDKRLEAGRAEVGGEKEASFLRRGVHLEGTARGQVLGSGQSGFATAEREVQRGKAGPERTGGEARPGRSGLEMSGAFPVSSGGDL